MSAFLGTKKLTDVTNIERTLLKYGNRAEFFKFDVIRAAKPFTSTSVG
jgi:hypothetical protein